MLVRDGHPIDADVFARRTGWSIRPEGACKDDTCIPLPDRPVTAQSLSERLGMAIATSPGNDVIALGPPSIGGRALDSVTVPHDLDFLDFDDNTVRLRDVRGSRTVLVSWAPW
jgi:hypothetical protein